MSLRKKKTEIKRLIGSFEREADKFHDLTFSLFYVTDEGPIDNRKFKPPNHTIMLWQYYGKIEPQGGAEKFVENLKGSDLQQENKENKGQAPIYPVRLSGVRCPSASYHIPVAQPVEYWRQNSRLINALTSFNVQIKLTVNISVFNKYLCNFMSQLTPSAVAVCGVAICASVAASTKRATEQTVRLARLVSAIYSDTTNYHYFLYPQFLETQYQIRLPALPELAN